MSFLRPNLRQLQNQFAHYIRCGSNESSLSLLVNEPAGIQAKTRLEVYRNGYYTRLQETLAKDFPALLAVMGNASFGKVMAAYMQANPSTEPSIRHLGKKLAGWLKTRDYPAVWSELAALEWAVPKAFDAVDACCLSTEQLSLIPPVQWESLLLHLHPSVALLCTSYETVSVIVFCTRLPIQGVNKKQNS